MMVLSIFSVKTNNNPLKIHDLFVKQHSKGCFDWVAGVKAKQNLTNGLSVEEVYSRW